MSTVTGSAGGVSRVLHRHARELGEDLAVEVLVEVAGVAAVGQQGDREALLRQQAQERRLADGVAVVADEPVAVPAEADPAEAPRVAEGVLVGQVGVLGGHRGGAGLAEHPGAVGRDAAGEVGTGEGEHVGGGRR